MQNCLLNNSIDGGALGTTRAGLRPVTAHGFAGSLAVNFTAECGLFGVVVR